MAETCIRCGCADARRILAPKLLDVPARALFLVPWHCRTCNRRFYRFQSKRTRTVVSGLAGLLLLAAALAEFPITLVRKALPQGTSGATVLLNAVEVALGQEVVVDIDHVPDSWSGALSVNSVHRFPFRSKQYRLRATVENGFKRRGVTDLKVTLLDRNGVDVPIKDSDGHYALVMAPTSVRVHPESQVVEAEPNSRAVVVDARPGYEWAVSGRPEWVTIRSAETGTGEGKIDYDVQRNTSNEARSAQLTIGDTTFDIRQRRPLAVQVPYRESFSSHVPPSPIWFIDKSDDASQPEPASRWFLDEQPGRHSTVTVGSGGPGGSNSLVVDSRQADSRAWMTQLELPHIAVQEDASYVVSLFLKADVPGPVSISFMQSSAPYQSCGLSHTVAVTNNWTAFTVRFEVSGTRCGAANNRLAIQTASVVGKLWIANISFDPGAVAPAKAGKTRLE